MPPKTYEKSATRFWIAVAQLKGCTIPSTAKRGFMAALRTYGHDVTAEEGEIQDAALKEAKSKKSGTSSSKKSTSKRVDDEEENGNARSKKKVRICTDKKEVEKSKKKSTSKAR